MTERPPVDGGTALITGASSGIGRQFATQLASRAGTLVIVARRAGLLEGLRAELAAAHPRLQVVAAPIDLSDERDVDRGLASVREQVGAVDVLINNAGLGDQALFDRTDWTRTRQVLHTNVVAVAQLTARLVPSMVERGRGGVLNMGSGAGLTVMPAAAAYSASKHFVDGFSEGLRADLAGTGVVVTQVCPGPVDSDFDTVAGSAGGMTGGPPQFLRISAARCALEALRRLRRRQAPGLPGTALPDRDASAPGAPPLPATPPGGLFRRAPSQPGPRSGGIPLPARGGIGEGDTGVRISRLVLSGAALGTIAGTGRADLNRTHVFNPGWPPHARFHSAAGWGSVAGSQLLALWLLWRPGEDADDGDLAIKIAALLPAVAWVPFFPALATPGTAVEDEPGHLARIAGVPANLVPATLIPIISAVGYTLHRHGR